VKVSPWLEMGFPGFFILPPVFCGRRFGFLIKHQCIADKVIMDNL